MNKINLLLANRHSIPRSPIFYPSFIYSNINIFKHTFVDFLINFGFGLEREWYFPESGAACIDKPLRQEMIARPK